MVNDGQNISTNTAEDCPEAMQQTLPNEESWFTSSADERASERTVGEMIYPSNYPTVVVIHTTTEWKAACEETVRRRATERKLRLVDERDFAKAVELASGFPREVINPVSGETTELYDLRALMPERRCIIASESWWSRDRLVKAIGLLGKGSHLAIIDLAQAKNHEEVERLCRRLRGSIGFDEVWLNDNSARTVKDLCWAIVPTPSMPLVL